MKGRDICFLTAALSLLLYSCEKSEHVLGGAMDIYRADSFADVLLYVDAVNEHGVESLALPVDHAPKYCPEGYSGPIFEVRIGLGQGDEDAPLWEHALREGQEIRLEYNWFIGVLAFYQNLEGGDPCVVLVRDTILFQGFSFHDLPQGEPGERLQEEWKEALLSPVPSGGMSI